MDSGEIVWLVLAEKLRPAVVLEVRGEFVRVAYGASVPPDGLTHVLVVPDSRAGRRFGLTADTYFVGKNVALERARELRAENIACPLELFYEIRALVEHFDASIRRREREQSDDDSDLDRKK